MALAAAFGPAITAVVLLQWYPQMTAVEEDNLCTSRPDAKPPTMVVDNPMNRASARLSSYRDSRRSSRRADVEEALSAAPTVSLAPVCIKSPADTMLGLCMMQCDTKCVTVKTTRGSARTVTIDL